MVIYPLSHLLGLAISMSKPKLFMKHLSMHFKYVYIE